MNNDIINVLKANDVITESTTFTHVEDIHRSVLYIVENILEVLLGLKSDDPQSHEYNEGVMAAFCAICDMFQELAPADDEEF
jgi:hypothetical protein